MVEAWLIAEPRSNSLVVRSDNPSRLFRLRSLVAMLILGVGAALYVWRGMTSDSTSNCLAGAFLGQSPKEATPAASDKPAAPEP